MWDDYEYHYPETHYRGSSHLETLTEAQQIDKLMRYLTTLVGIYQDSCHFRTFCPREAYDSSPTEWTIRLYGNDDRVLAVGEGLSQLAALQAVRKDFEENCIPKEGAKLQDKMEKIREIERLIGVEYEKEKHHGSR